jgi:Protein of unknown function (DUF2806)
MGEGNSLINLGELSKPATVLIEKISDAIGGVYRPHQIRKVASAEAEAEIIKAEAAIKVERLRTEAEIEISNIQRRAISRFFIEEGQKQKNIETIIRKALPELSEDAQPQNIENDWLVNFFDKCRLISDEEMQSLWAKILAGEANTSGKFSKRTINALISIDKEDAKLFTALCKFAVGFGVKGTYSVAPFIYDYSLPIYEEQGINFSALTHLSDIGLINFDTINGYSLGGFPQKIFICYGSLFSNAEFIDSLEKKNHISVGQVLFTKLGIELALVCEVEPVNEFYNFIIQKLLRKKLTLYSSFPKQTLEEALSL